MSYPGEERRKTDSDLARLTAEAGARLSALEDTKEELSYTRRAVGQLAEAMNTLDAKVAAAPSRAEVEVRARMLRRSMFQIAAMLAALLVIILLANTLFVAGLNGHMDKGHSRITCLLRVPAEQRTPDYRAACGVRE